MEIRTARLEEEGTLWGRGGGFHVEGGSLGTGEHTPRLFVNAARPAPFISSVLIDWDSRVTSLDVNDHVAI